MANESVQTKVVNAKPKRKGIRIPKKYVPFLLLAPTLVFYLLFWVVPVIEGTVQAFTDTSGNFTFNNFVMMVQSNLFSEAVLNTLIFAAISVVIQYFIALLLSVILSRKFFGSKFFLFIAMIPMAITPTAVAILWKTALLNNGWLNSILVSLGLVSHPVQFLGGGDAQSLAILILIDTWTVMPSVMIILVAGLQNINEELKSAAYLFGASKWRVFKDITLPLLKPAIVTSIILRLIAALQIWSTIVMVFGFSTVPTLVERIAYYVQVVPGVDTSQKLAFAYSLTTTLIVFIITMVYFKVSKRNSSTARGEK